MLQEGSPGGPDDTGARSAGRARDGRSPRPASREAIAHAFLAEYHRLLAEALPDPVALPTLDGGAAARRQAFAWRVTAARIGLVPDRCWPGWLLEHLRVAAESPALGPEYRRQLKLLVELLGVDRDVQTE